MNSELVGITELFLPEDQPAAGQVFPGPRPLPQALLQTALALTASAKAKAESDFTVTLEGTSFRMHRMPTSNGPMLICRQIPKEIWTLDRCGLPSNIRAELMSPRLNMGGLVLIAGKPGSGKSVTTAALIKARLEEFAGICITVEDPVEMPLQGSHGSGYCLQRGVFGQEAYAGAVRDAMRAYPTQANSILMIGEARDPETAALALRASVDGRLVLTTVHAGDPVQAIYRILSLASHSVGARESRDLLAAGIRAVIHQRLKNERLYVSTIFDTHQVAGVIRNREASLELLRNEVATQRNQLKLSLPVDVRKLGQGL